MKTFLEEVAQKLLAENTEGLENVAVVFNNNRSGLFLTHQFQKIHQGTFFLPQIMSIDNFVSKLSHQEIIPKEFLLFELYSVHNQLNDSPLKFSTFEEFMPIGEMMLNDFSEIDLYLQDAEQIFGNLFDLKSIEQWEVDSPELTQGQRNYLAFYKSLFLYYSTLKSNLAKKHKAFSGMAYRNVAEHIDSMANRINYKKIYFVGFNVLSKSESTIVEYFVKMGLGELITDGDAYYFNDDKQEAGRLLKKLHKSFPLKDPYENHFEKGEKKITLVSCPEKVAQAKYAGKVLQEISNKGTDGNSMQSSIYEDTAVILADEKMLIPVLNSLPESVETANITMGFPFNQSDMFDLGVALISLYDRMRGHQFYHADIINVLSSSILSKLLGVSNMRLILLNEFSRKKVIRAELETIKSVMKKSVVDFSSVEFLFSPSGENPPAEEILAIFDKLARVIHSSECLKNNVKEKEALACFLNITNHLNEIQEEYHYINNLTVLKKIFQRLSQRHNLSFYGEPLSGLQILGMLEARNLDFKRVILLSTNEEKIPSGKSPNTLIPYSLKCHFGIPTYEDRDAIYAHHFYRLIQRAEEVYLIYSTETTDGAHDEPSRFITQIKEELCPQYANIQLIEKALSIDNNPCRTTPTESVEKDEYILKRLEEINKKGFSASALNNYRSCPMRYFYSNILSISENEDIEENLDNSELGTCIHNSLQTIYSSAPKGVVTQEFLEQKLKECKEIVKQNLDSMITNGNTNEGFNHFMYQIATYQTESFLKQEIEFLKKGNQLKINYQEGKPMLEFEMSREIEVTMADNSTKTLKIHGFADRIDSVNGKTRVVDYKTGKVEGKDLKINSKKNDYYTAEYPDKLFQLALYKWMFNEEGISSGIIPLKDAKTYYLEGQLDNITNNDFEESLQGLLAELMNPEIPFVTRPGKENCKYCPMISLCNPSEWKNNDW